MKIDVLEDGTVHIFSTSGAGGDQALQMVRDVTASAEIGKTYLGKVVRLAEFGAFVELFPGTDGLLHISEISEHRIRDVRDELKLGDQVLVKVLAIEGNKIRLSRKALIKEAREKQAKKQETPSRRNSGARGYRRRLRAQLRRLAGRKNPAPQNLTAKRKPPNFGGFLL